MKEKRVHDLAAAGAGDLGVVPVGEILGACPSCGAEMRTFDVMNPRSGRIERALRIIRCRSARTSGKPVPTRSSRRS